MFEKYDAYKDSGVEWLGQIPSHWQVTRMKNLFRLVMNFAPKNNNAELLSVYTDIGVKPRKELEERGNKASTTDGYLFVQKGDIVVNKLLAWMGAIGLSEYNGVTSPAYDILRPKVPMIGKFYHNMFRMPVFSSELKKHSRGIMDMRLRLYFDKFGDVLVPSPPFEEQTAIIQFLDQKTAEIDQAIAIKEQLITLLNERKQIVIQKAVTQGLDPNVPMKDSGVEWIGQIPEHWKIIRSKFLFTQRKENSRKDDVQLSATQAYGVIPQEEYEKRTGKSVVKISLHLDKRKRVHLNDFVISMRSFQGGLERAWAEGCIRSSYVVLKPLKPIDPDYYGYLFKTPMYIKALQNTSNFIRDGQDLNFGNFSQVDLFIVPLSEQKQIVEYIKSQLGDFEKHLELLNQQIEKLKEYKTTLINDAVTGKIKVA